MAFTEQELIAVVQDFYAKREAFQNDRSNLKSKGPQSETSKAFFHARKALLKISAMVSAGDNPISAAIFQHGLAHRAVEPNAGIMCGNPSAKQVDECGERMAKLEQAEIAMFAAAGCERMTTAAEKLERFFPNLKSGNGGNFRVVGPAGPEES